MTQREHLELVWKQSGKKPPELDVPQTPQETAYILDMFLDLSAARPMGMTASAITYEAIDAYSRLRGIDLSPFEVDALRQLDMAWFKVRSQHNG